MKVVRTFPGMVKIIAANFGGKLGLNQFKLQELLKHN
jgi:formylmethanofuran:tetrahydromethanopterin formyltransferase